MGNGASTLALKLMGGVNRSPKQRVPVAPQNSDIAIYKISVRSTGLPLVQTKEIKQLQPRLASNTFTLPFQQEVVLVRTDGRI